MHRVSAAICAIAWLLGSVASADEPNASLTIDGNPAGTKVVVTDRFSFHQEGTFPFKLKDLRPNEYNIYVAHDGYKDSTKRVVVAAGKAVAVRLVLEQLIYLGWQDLKVPENGNVKPFRMMTREVTVEMFKPCVEVGRCAKPGTGEFCNWGVAGKENHPINCVDREQAEAYCHNLNGILPTEREWELAAGGKGSKYPWGKAPLDDTRANYGSKTGTDPVGSRPAGSGPFGHLNLAGNVAEWVSDDAGKKGIVRGGSWRDHASGVGTAARKKVDAKAQEDWIGFRCAAGPPVTMGK